MKDIKSFYTGVILVATIVVCSCFIGQTIKPYDVYQRDHIVDTDYGLFLASQHALYVNDFNTASKMAERVKSDSPEVNYVKNLTAFFDGKIVDTVPLLKDTKDMASRLMYDAYLVKNDKWSEIYKRYSKNTSSFLTGLRVFSSVQQGKFKEAIQYVNKSNTATSWKAFIRGQIAVLNNDIDTAAKEFAKVHPDFMNINDYLYLMSFYRENNMTEDMDILRYDFMSKPGSLYLFEDDVIPDWSNYSGIKNNLVFSIIQNVSHAKIWIFTDVSLLLLKFAENISDGAHQDAINYYLGQYYFYNSGDYEKSFNAVSEKNPLYLYGQLKIAENRENYDEIKKLAKKNPLFIPVVKLAVNNEVKNGNMYAALRYVNRALRQKNLSEEGKIYFLKNRADIYLLFNRPNKAQKDMDRIMDLDDRLLSDVLKLQARIWLQQNKSLDRAYNYAMTVVKRDTSDISAWDVLGCIVEKREGVDAALEVLERVGEISMGESSLYEHLGDMYVKKGDIRNAKKSYLRALDLSDDGLVVIPVIEKKLRKLK